MCESLDENVARTCVYTCNRCTKTRFTSCLAMALALLALLLIGVTEFTAVNFDFIAYAYGHISNVEVDWI